MILVLDFRAVGDHEADFAEAANDIFGYLSQRVELAQNSAAAWQSKIDRFFGERGFEFEFAAALGKRGFQFGFGKIDSFASSRLFFLRQRAELLHQGGKLSV